MRGKLYKHPKQGWTVKYSICVPGMITRQWGAELPLHPDNVKDIKEWSKVFDNIEGRISSNPEAEFEIVSGFNNNGPEHFPRYAKLIKDEEADLKDFDVTLMDGLEEEPIETPVFNGSGQWHRRAYLYLKGDKVVFDCSDDEYGPIKFDLKDLEKALETHKEKKI
jgi:hypothetical protein